MLHFFPPGMLERYLLFTYLSILGILQLIAAHYRVAGLSLPGRRHWQWGYAIGAGLLSGAYLWFFGRVQHLIFVPGLAGTELFTAFAVSTLLALGTTLAVVSLLHRSPAPAESRGERVDFDPGRGTINWPKNATQWPAVVAVSGLPDGDFPIYRLADRLAKAGCVTLNIDLASDGPVEYPGVLARLPAACAYLQNQTAVDGQGVVLVGAGLGGDLVLRAAAADSTVAGVVAVDPWLRCEVAGFDILRRSTFWEAIRWGSLRHRLTKALASADHLAQLEKQHALVVYRAEPTISDGLQASAIDLAIAQTNDEAIDRIARWMSDLITST